MRVNHDRVVCVKGDAILVEALLLGPEKIGSIYVPDSAKRNGHKSRRSAWRGRVVMFGEDVDHKQWAPHEVSVGDVVLLAPESAECPRIYDDDDGSHERPYIFVRDEDVLAKEVIDAQA